MKSCIIHYFSGTGNTYIMVKAMERELKSSGYEVQLCNIEKQKQAGYEKYQLHLFCFPIYGFGAPGIMMKYLAQLPLSKGTRAAVVCTSAGFEGVGVQRSVSILKKRGFDVFFSDMVIYTYNWTQVVNPQSKETEAKVFEEADTRIKYVIKRITTNEIGFLKRNILILSIASIFYFLFSRVGRRMLGKGYIADDSCNSCGKCERICPSRTISMYGGKPRWSMSCEGCQRCINICPKEAIQFSVLKLAVIAGLELLPIWLVAEINRNVASLPFYIDILLFGLLFIIGTFVAIALLNAMEKLQFLRKVLQISYTKKFRRNVASGYELE